MRILLPSLALQRERLLQMVARIRVLLQIELGKSCQLPCFGIARIVGRDRLCLFGCLGILLLLKQLKRVRRVG